MSTQKDIEVTAMDYHNALDKLTEVMVYDIFSPPVASRVYVYPSIASYEIAIQDTANTYNSLSGQIEHFSPIPKLKNPSEVNLEYECGDGLSQCRRRTDFFNPKNKSLQRQHLSNLVKITKI